MHTNTIRCSLALLLLLAFLVTASPALAELQTVAVGGEIRIRGNYWRNSFNPRIAQTLVGPEARIPATLLQGRPIGDYLGGQNAVSYWDWDSDRADYRLVEQRTVLNVRADFTDDVAAFIELESFDAWGEDFRSQDYVTGVDARAVTQDDVEVYQAYIETNNLFGAPVRVRSGRQELFFGGGWLVGNSSAMPEFRGLSFDGVRLTYAADAFTTDAFHTKLAERTGLEEDGDIDFSGLYASCTALENVAFDAYWLWVRDARAVEDVAGNALGEWIEEILGLDSYPVTNLHTIGLRATGQIGAFDFAAEAAYQFGDAGQVGSLFKSNLYGDDGADSDAWAAHLEAGYTFETAWQPRISVRAAYFDGEDNRDLTFLEWLNPFYRPEASISFNRLFSNTVYSYFFDEMAQMSNAWTVGIALGLTPTECLELKLSAAYFAAIEEFDLPKSIRIGGSTFYIAGPLTFWTDESDSELGWDITLSAIYHYSEDLEFEAGWSHLFSGDGLTGGNYIDFNGLLFSGGTDDDDADYFYVQTLISF